ncbi:acetyl esterase [Colletotrichum sublineola]|nr:acetyl esterase [Colletotrichum sublineola]
MLFLPIAALASVAAAFGCGIKKFENLVTFGDSYTDEGRLGYFINNNGSAPPAGVLLPPSNATASGGYAWGRFVANSTGAKYYNYAVGGATCSNKIISRNFAAIHQPFPSVLDYEIPAYKVDTAFNALYSNREANNTVYALWIGTNDLGYGAFLTDSNAPGTTISSYVNCVWEVFDNIYATGGRHFVLLNIAPLEQSPLYAATELGGFGNSIFWPNKTSYNTTETQYKMLEYSTSVNTAFDYGVPFHLLVRKRWPGASFSVFDVNTLLRDVHAEPSKYLSSPPNVMAPYRVCDPVTVTCVNSPEPKASFLWYDELHPSERASEIVAQHFIDVLHGNSTYGKTYASWWDTTFKGLLPTGFVA